MASHNTTPNSPPCHKSTCWVPRAPLHILNPCSSPSLVSISLSFTPLRFQPIVMSRSKLASPPFMAPRSLLIQFILFLSPHTLPFVLSTSISLAFSPLQFTFLLRYKCYAPKIQLDLLNTWTCEWISNTGQKCSYIIYNTKYCKESQYWDKTKMWVGTSQDILSMSRAPKWCMSWLVLNYLVHYFAQWPVHQIVEEPTHLIHAQMYPEVGMRSSTWTPWSTYPKLQHHEKYKHHGSNNNVQTSTFK